MGCVLFNASVSQSLVIASGDGCGMTAGKSRPLSVVVGAVVDSPGAHPGNSRVVVKARQLGVANVGTRSRMGSVRGVSYPSGMNAKCSLPSCSTVNRMPAVTTRKVRPVAVQCSSGQGFGATMQSHLPEVYVGIICPVYYGTNVLLDDMTRLSWDDGSYMKY